MFRQYLRYLVRDIMNEAFGKKEFTEQELAEKADLLPRTVKRLRTGKTRDPKFQTIFKLMTTLEMDVDTVLKEMKELSDG